MVHVIVDFVAFLGTDNGSRRTNGKFRGPLTEDMLCFGDIQSLDCLVAKNPMLCEYCDRLNIAETTKAYSNDLYIKLLSSYPFLKKDILAATSIYITTKRNKIPRTLKEVSSATGVEVKKIGEYEKIVSKKYYPVHATHYLYRFGFK